MAFDLAESHGWIVAELARRRPVDEAMAGLVGLCQATSPHPDWTPLGSLPFADLSPLAEWIRRPFRDEPPARPLRGLWFGLFNPCVGRETLADLYVCGSERFDPDPVDNDWAVWPAWRPEARCAGSSVLADIYRIAHREGGLGNDAEYPLCLGYAAFAVRALLGQVEPSLILGSSESLGVAVGFDSGDFVLLGDLGSSGWSDHA